MQSVTVIYRVLMTSAKILVQDHVARMLHAQLAIINQFVVVSISTLVIHFRGVLQLEVRYFAVVVLFSAKFIALDYRTQS